MRLLLLLIRLPHPKMASNTPTDAERAASPEELQRRAYAKVLRCASACEQSSARIRKKLRIAGFTEDAIAHALEKATRLGVIDDMRYAECLVRSTALAGKGMEIAKREISALGLHIEDLEAYQEYLAGGEEAQIEAAVDLLQRHPSRAKDKRAAGMRKLISKGYSMPIASRAVAIWSDGV